jgi:NarL family two-component system response regulator LiaR
VIRVFHCDDSLAYRRLVRAMLSSDQGIEIVGEAPSHAEALGGISATQPDVILLDMVVGPQDPGFPEALAAAAPQARLLILSGHPPERADPGLRAMALRHVRKTTAFDELARAIHGAMVTDSTNVL